MLLRIPTPAYSYSQRIAGPMLTIVRDQLILLLYGDGYIEATTVLQIHVWACMFVFLGVVGSKWYIIENFQRINLYWTALGAIINVCLNLVLIPRYGPTGAAISTVASYAIAAYFLDATTRDTYYLFRAKSRALFPGPLIIEWIKRGAG